MNKKYINIIVLLLLSQAASSMQTASKLVRNGARIGGGLILLGKGIDIALVSSPFLTRGLASQEDFDSNGSNFRYMFRDNFELGKVAARSCTDLTVGSALLGVGMLGMYTGSLLLSARYDKASFVKAAKLCCCLPLFTAGITTWHSAVGFIFETLYANDGWRCSQAMGLTGLFGATSAVCLRTCFRLFSYSK